MAELLPDQIDVHPRAANSIVIVGAGGLGREILAALDAANEAVAGFLVEPGMRSIEEVAGLPVRDDRDAWTAASQPGGPHLILAVGDGRARARIAARLGPAAFFAVARHPAAVLGPRVTLGDGAMLLGPLSITVDAVIGAHVLLNPGCTVAHDCRIGDFASLGPRVALAGRVTVEAGAVLGTGAVVAPGCRIGAWSVVGAGAVVIRDVAPGATVVGVPAHPLPQR